MASHTQKSISANQKFGEFVSNLTFDQIPDEVISKEKFHLIDTVGCMMFGSTTPWVNRFLSAFDRLDSQGEAQIIGKNRYANSQSAIQVNGTASHSMDYDDYCLDGGIHSGASTIPPALAYSDVTENLTGEEFLTAITAGVEVGIRVGMGIGRGGGIQKGFHIGGWTGSAAAAATTGWLLDLTSDEMAHAMAMSLTLGAGFLGAARGANIKRFHMGRAAESGYLAAHFAKESVKGDPDMWEKRWGSLYSLAGDGMNPQAAVEGIGDEYAILEKLCFKPFPSVGTIHPSVTALENTLNENDVSPASVDSVEITVTQNVRDKVGWEYIPVDVMSAQGSVRYALGAFLEDGKLTIKDYSESAIKRQSVVERANNNISINVDTSLGEQGAYDFLDDSPYKRSRRVKMKVITESGEEYTRIGEVPKGWPDNPVPEEETLDKFRNLASNVLTSDSLQKLEKELLDIETSANVSQIFENTS